MNAEQVKERLSACARQHDFVKIGDGEVELVFWFSGPFNTDLVAVATVGPGEGRVLSFGDYSYLATGGTVSRFLACGEYLPLEN